MVTVGLLVAMVRAADAEAVLVPDTAMHALTIIDDLEAAIGKPDQVTVWKGLQLPGPVPQPAGLGALFSGSGGEK
jgi:maleate cis-trans isomerase